PEMHVETDETCPTCRGKGNIQASILIIDEIENKLQALAKQNKHKLVVIKTHPFLEAYINRKKGFRSLKKRWQKKYNIQLKVVASTTYHLTEYHFFNNDEEEISL
ncbi:MAG: ribonuclease E/G, partial [Bacteroidales bacterium]